MKFTIVQRAGEHEVFASTAFDGQVGKPVWLRRDGRDAGTAVLVAATVAADGRAVELTFDGPVWMAGPCTLDAAEETTPDE